MSQTSDLVENDLGQLLGDITVSDAFELLCSLVPQYPSVAVAQHCVSRQLAFIERLITATANRVAERMHSGPMIDDSDQSTDVLRNFWRNSITGSLYYAQHEDLSRIPVQHACQHYELRLTRYAGDEEAKARGYQIAGSDCSTCTPGQGRTPVPNYKTLAQAQAAISPFPAVRK